MEYKTLSATALKLKDDGPGRLEGYASTFGHVDSYGDTIAKGAYLDTIPDFLYRGFLADEHDWARRVGTIDMAREDDKGLFIGADFHSDSRAQDMRRQVAERLERGKFVGLSIGYEPLDFEFRQVAEGETVPFGDKVRILKRIKLYETSVVSVPADAFAAVTGAKAGRRLSAESQAHIQSAVDALTALLAEVSAASEVEASDPPAEAEAAPEAVTVAGLREAGADLATVGERLVSDLHAYAAWVQATPDADLRAAKDWVLSASRRLADTRRTLDDRLRRAEEAGAYSPAELEAQFRALDARLGLVLGGGTACRR